MSTTSHRHDPGVRDGPVRPVGAARAGSRERRRAGGPRTLIGEARRGEVHAMSFEIGPDDEDAGSGLDPWPAREPLVTRLLELEQPTVLGVQDVGFEQLRAVEDGLPLRYRMVGSGAEGGSRGAHCPIFYDGGRLRLEAWEQWWHSETPGLTGSTAWGATTPRVTVWARFVELATERAFAVVNTRLEADPPEAREQAATLLARRVRRDALPTVVTGGFGRELDDDCPLARTAHLCDTWTSASQRLTPLVGTTRTADGLDPDGPRVDQVLASPGVRVLRSAINTTTFLGRVPSRHVPVQALLRL